MFMAVIGLLIFLHFVKILKPVENVIISILNPISSGIYSVSSNLRIAYNEQTNKRDLLNLLNELEARVEELTAEEARLKAVEDENTILRQYLKFFNNQATDYVLANVLHEEDDIVIDKGAEDGLRPGLALVDSHGIIVGKIAAVKDNLARVSLVTSPECKLAASVQGESMTMGVAEGELGLTIKMNFIPRAENINSGDIVVTSGLEQDIPRGLVIGEIAQINQDSNDIWQSAVIKSAADLDKLVIVSVLLP